jgi:hypothetical protein
MGRAAGHVHAASGDLDEEQHVQSMEPDSIDGEEINCDHARRLRAQELAPCCTRPLSRGTELFLTQDLLHRDRRHDHGETFQLAHDTLITPAWIFAR